MNFKNNQKHGFHLVDPSLWLLIYAFFALMLTYGAVLFMHACPTKNFLLKLVHYPHTKCLSRVKKFFQLKFLTFTESFLLFYSLLGEIISEIFPDQRALYLFLAGFVLTILLIIFLYWSFSNFVKNNINKLTKICKEFQLFLETRQVYIYFFFNFVVFLLLLTVLEPVTCVILGVFWLHMWRMFLFFDREDIPALEGVICFVGLFRLFFGGFLNTQNFCVFCIFYYIYSLLDSLKIFNEAKAELKLFHEAQQVTLSHKKKGFFYFYVLEKSTLSVLICVFILPFFVTSETFSLFLSCTAEEADFLLGLKLYVFATLFACSVIGLIIITFFNTRSTFALLQGCFQCVAGAATIGGFSLCLYQDIWDRALGGVREPGRGPGIRWAQTSNLHCVTSTAHGVKIS